MATGDDNDTVSSSPGGFRLRWDVFLSFRGEDTRATITKSLYEGLEKRGVRVFRDDDALNRGDEIAPSLLEAIEDSTAAIVILSPRYAESKWCLEELAKICERRSRLILPVFYQVDPSHVRHQNEPFAKHFRVYEQLPEIADKVPRWRSAMEKVGGIAGYRINPSNEADGFIQRLVQRVLTEINKTPAAYTVGLDSRVEEVMRLLDLNVGSSGVRVLGIHGMGGVGKTTLAKALFNRLVGHFDCHCLISNVREISAGHEGLLSLQNKLIGNLSPNKVPPVNELETGVAAIRAIAYEKQILLVLDDVDNVSQLSALVGNNTEWFYKGSRIIVTTRDIKALPSHLVNKLYEVRELDSSKALQLFNYHALRREKSTDEFFNLSKEIAALTGGLPLALEVFGSYLFDKRKIEDWSNVLKGKA